MPLQINAATSGSTTLIPTDAVTATLTLPSSTGTLLSTANPQSGGVIQVVNATYATEVSTSTESYIDTGLTATITPKFSTSKILVIVDQVGLQKSTDNAGIYVKLVRGGTTLAQLCSNDLWNNTTTIARTGGAGVSYLDSPATTSATTYKTQFQAFYNRASATVQQGQATSTITLMEIAA